MKYKITSVLCCICLLTVVCCLCFSSCRSVTEDVSTPDTSIILLNDCFEVVADIDGRNTDITIYRDKITDVLYMCTEKGATYGNGAGLSVMYDADGNVLTYEKYKMLAEK